MVRDMTQLSLFSFLQQNDKLSNEGRCFSHYFSDSVIQSKIQTCIITQSLINIWTTLYFHILAPQSYYSGCEMTV